MESFISPEFLAVADPKQQQQQQQQQLLQATANFDFLSFTSPSDVLAPHPDLFESELDSSLAGFDPLQLQSLLLDQSSFDFLQNDITSCGPPSTITVSTESVSAYDSLSGQSESLYNYTPSNYSFPLDLEMDFRRATLNSQDYASLNAMQNASSQLSTDSRSDYMYSGASIYSSSSGSSPNDFADELEAYSASMSPPSPAARGGSVYSDYGSSQYNPIGANHPSLRGTGSVSPGMMHVQRTQISQVQVSAPIARAPSPIGTGLNMSLIPNISRSETAYRRSPESHVPHSAMERAQVGRHEEDKGHACPQCGKRFGRKYNMKSHLETHDNARLKKFKCECCQRSFSRKHDLRRHYLSIHGQVNPSLDDATATHNDNTSIGLATMVKAERCTGCGASERQCTCGDDEDE